ncbi:AraC family transcriptional regulator [Salipiger aestuarii]|uniref:AraC-like DNA-binding protein n=1 Tax=Salipiger aestuarii TaxID=568098 RepID=A0A327YFA4_9RHOB|nr:helix-turn-helix domain-containing protein [Salipiger aestuarii]EIE51454.1 helix-turn-helix domain-containing protein [Citreicella sp. 357]KAA8608924.1 AraC family transcriptional regulator [Salipiger aestuarii]KAA8613126.1 AraC family transcriptional regulator [Salipiger aestuarii]KAB2543019.1 AraC family transcriptional regulator [Salipiger aestuarii]RAK19720.1 AraC-like DNA-binding protein [Salipiger aestuarii]
MILRSPSLTLTDPLRVTLGSLQILHRGQGRSHHVNAAAPGAAPGYHLIFPTHAPVRFCQSGLTGEARPGAYVLLRADRFYDLRAATDLAQWAAVLPARALRDRLAGAEAHVGGRFRPNPQMSALVSRTLSATAQVFRSAAPPPRPEALAAEIVALTALMIGAEEDCDDNLSRTGRSRTRQRIMDHIETHLSDPALDPGGVASAVGVSRSYLYALFAEGNETVAGFIRNRRLQAAYEILVADARGGVAISEVAYRTGFRSVSHFSRSFSRHFQATPRDIRAGLAPLDR